MIDSRAREEALAEVQQFLRRYRPSNEIRLRMSCILAEHAKAGIHTTILQAYQQATQPPS